MIVDEPTEIVDEPTEEESSPGERRLRKKKPYQSPVLLDWGTFEDRSHQVGRRRRSAADAVDIGAGGILTASRASGVLV